MITWQPIEAAPKDGTDILLLYPQMTRRAWVGCWHESTTTSFGRVTSQWTGWLVLGMAYTFGKDGQQPTAWAAIPDVTAAEPQNEGDNDE